MQIDNISPELKKENDSDLHALKGKCDSELEKQVFDMIVELDLPISDEAQKTFYKDDEPLVKGLATSIVKEIGISIFIIDLIYKKS